MKIIQLIVLGALVNHIKITAANKKELEHILRQRRESIGLLLVLLIAVAILAILGLVLVF